MDLSQFEKILKTEPAYRLRQAKQAVFVDSIENWETAITFPTELRKKLDEQCPLGIKAKIHLSGDGRTAKAIIDLRDGFRIESVLMRYEAPPFRQACSERGRTAQGRNTICLSSQVGCALGCNFCATGKAGFKRNLTVDEIVEQVLLWARWLKNNVTIRPALRRRLRQGKQAQGENKITNLVFMGMGEPFLNYDNVLESIRILNDRDGFNLGARHFSISTAGIVGEIKKLAEEPLQINLAISLHAPTDELRSKLMPIGKKYTIKKILSAVDKYIAKTNRKVMFEYIMIDGVNDSEKQARQLVKLMNPSASCCRQTKRPLYHIRQAQCKFINLILCNPIGDFRPSPQERIEKFKKILKDAGIQVNQRYSFGQDISAACGQLSWPAGN